MLRDAGVRTKLLAVLTIPTLLLVMVTGLLVAGQISEARRAGQVATLAGVSTQVNQVVHALQAERTATLTHLEVADTGGADVLSARRAETDTQIAELDSTLAQSSVPQLSEAVQAALARMGAGHGEVAGFRASVDAGRLFATETDVFYSRVISADLDLPGVVAASGTPELARSLQAYQALSNTSEYASHERDVVQIGLATGALNEAEFAQAAALVAQQRQSMQDVQAKSSKDLYGRLTDALAGADNSGIDRVRRDLPELLTGRDPAAARSANWVIAADTRITAMTTAESQLLADISGAAEAIQSQQERRSLLLATVAVLGLGLAALLAISLARRITRPLRRLTVAAGEIGAELPRMVERMQIPGEGPGVVVEPIAVESSDEIGRLAAAFNTVNDVTVQVAREQAALRASIAEMFVNVARRNQVLLGRQLKALDAMESGEEDPDALERLFTLDHLATRMRRNAESLLVLAGIDSTRRLRHTMPLSDVIRTAVGEIEAFERIDLSMTEDPEVSGRQALTIAHLLAELLENATHFSNPDTRVIVSATQTGSGFDVTITDSGLGMSEVEVAEANEKIAHPLVAEIAVSQRLGHLVVGRLAAKLGAAVELRRGRTAGTAVAVSLPVAVFEGLAVAEPGPAVEGVAEPAVDVVPAGEVAPEVEVEPVVEPEPEPEPVLEPESVAVVEPEPVLEPEPEPVVEPAPEPVAADEPVAMPTFAFTPAVDILPTRSAGGGRRARRAPLPSREPAPVAAAVPPTSAVVAPPAPLEPPAPPAPPVPPSELPARRVSQEAEHQAGALLPSRSAPAAPMTAPPAPSSDQETPTARSDLASSALSELRSLYEPTFAPAVAPAEAPAGGLVRRTPSAAPAASVPATPSTPPATSRERTAGQVRGMLTGFRAGVERGRSGATDPVEQPAAGPDNTDSTDSSDSSDSTDSTDSTDSRPKERAT